MLTSLNAVIDAVLDANNDPGGFFDPAAGATTQAHVFTTTDDNVPDKVVVGEDSGGQADLELSSITLTFQPGVEFIGGSWTGEVTVVAPDAVLYPDLLDIAISDDGTDTENGDDADENAVVGAIDLAAGNAETLTIDSLDATDLGLPAFLDIAITDIGLNFDDFRGDDESSTLQLDASIGGIDTGSEILNDQLTSLTVSGSIIGLELDMDLIKNGFVDSDGDIRFPVSPIKDLGGVTGEIEGELFAAEVDGSFIVNTVTVDPDGAGPQEEQSVLYAALEGNIAIEDIVGVGFAFAFSELGPLQIFAHSDVDIPLESTSGLVASNLRLGARFSTTIEDLQTETDFTTTSGSFDATESQVTLVIPDHDLAVGNTFRVRNADKDTYDGEFEVLAVDGNNVTYAVDADPGAFVGDAEIVRVTITDPLDLRDSGLTAGVGVPDSVADWREQLDVAVTNQIEAGDDVWGRLFSEFVLGGGATLSFDPRIPSDVLEFDVDFMLGSSIDDGDVSLALWLKGEMSLYDGTLTIPASLYADIGTSDEEFSGNFLFLADVSPNIPDVEVDPLLVLRASVSFTTMDDGFEITLAGGFDVNVPEVTTVTLEGTTTLTVQQEADLIQMDLDFNATLSEQTVGNIAAADGAFHAVINTTTNTADVWGAAIMGTDFGFLEQFGLFASASGLLRLNTSDADKPDEVLEDVDGNEVTVPLPSESFALRLDGNVDFRIDYDGDGEHESSESAFQAIGTFVLEFSPDGFNVALFRPGADGEVLPAVLRVGPKSSPFVEFGVLGFLGIRENGFAADLVLTVDRNLPLGLASIEGTAVFIVNTTEEDVEFQIPGGVEQGRPNDLTITIPDAAPANPSAILAAPDASGTESGLDDLISGSPTWTEGAAGAYGVVFVDAEMELLEVLEFDASGYILLSEDVVSLEVNIYAGGNFLGLASGSVGGSLFFSSQGEFEASIDARVQLGPDWININGGADLTISYLDSDGKGSAGDENFVLDIDGSLSVGLRIDISPFPSVDVSLDALSVGYNSATGSITVGVGYPEPFWDSYCVDLGWFGSACFPYPNVRTRTYNFTVGTLQLNDPPPPPVLGQVDANGVLTVNAGTSAARALRNLRTEEINESVTIDAVGPLINGRQDITLRMFDVTQTFEGVTRINVADMNDGNDAIEILSPVRVPSLVYLGAGDDRLVNRGSGSVTAYGQAGSDRLTGTTVSEHLLGGAGNDVIEGGGGADTIQGGAGEDALLVAVRGNASRNVNVNISDTGFTATIGDDPLPQITDIETLDIENAGTRAQSDTYTITYATDTVNSVLRQVNLNLGSDSVADTVIVNGAASSDTFDISTSTVTRRVTVPTGVGTETRTTEIDVDGIRVAHRGGVNLDILDVGSDFGADTLTINGKGDADTINVNSTLAGVTTTINGGAGVDIVNVGSRASEQLSGNLDRISGTLVVNGNAGNDVLTLDDTVDETASTNGVLTGTTVAGLGIGAGITYGTVGAININLGSGGDAFRITSTHSGSTNLNSGGGSDTIDVSSTAGATTVGGGSGNDTLRVNHSGAGTNGLAGAVVLDGEAGSDNHSVTIFGSGSTNISVLDSGTSAVDSDSLTFHATGNSDDLLLRASNTSGIAFVAALNDDQAERVNYDTRLETLTVNAGGGADRVTLGRGETAFALESETSTDASVISQVRLNLGSDGVKDDVVFNGSGNADTFDISTDAALYEIARRGDVTLTIGDVGSGADTVTVRTHAGTDTININQTLASATTTVDGGNGLDTINIGSAASSSGNGTLEGIAGPLTVNGNNGADVLNLDDTGDVTGETDGRLTSNTINGLGIGAGITYGTIDALNINLGSGADAFHVASTHSAATQVSGGGGNDTIDVETVSGSTTILGQSGDDFLRVNNAVAAESNGLSGTLRLDGQTGGDNYDVNIFGNGGSLIEVFDSGSVGTDTLTIDGTDAADNFLLRASNTAGRAFVAALYTSEAERIEYDVRLENLIVNTAGGTDDITLGRAESGFAIGDETSTSASVLDQVRLNLGDDSVQDNVIFNGSSVADTIDVSTFVDGSEEVFSVARRGDTRLDIYESGTGFGRDTVTVDAQSSPDTINVNGTVGGTLTTVNAGSGLDTVNVGSEASQSGSGELEGIVGSLVVNGEDGADVLNLDDTGDLAGDTDGQLTATTIDGAGIGEGITYDSIKTLNVNLGNAADEFQIASTHAGDTRVSTGGGNDTVNVETIAGGTTVLGEAGDDNLRVNDAIAPESNGLATTLVLDGQTGNDSYDVNIYGNGDSLITVFDSGTSATDSDTLTINGTSAADDFVLRASTTADVGFVAALHNEDIERVNYDVRLENLIVDTADGTDNIILGRAESGFAISDETSTSASVLDQVRLNLGDDSVQDNVIVNGSSVADTIDVSTSVDGSEEVFSVARRGDTRLDIYESGAGFGRDTVTVNAQSSADTININGTVGGTLTTINAGAAVDTINVGSEASQAGSGDLEGVVGALVINGDNADDVLNIDDTGDTVGDTDGQLTATTIDGAGIGEGITYDSIKTLNINLGDAADEFQIASTHAGDTRVTAGDGNDTVNVETIAGGTTVLGEAGDDNLRVNDAIAPESNGLATTLVLDGQTGSDSYDINIYGNGDSLVTVFDSGTSATDSDTLTVNGTDAQDDFVLRASTTADVGFVAALHDENIERVNYDVRLENLIVDTATGTDNITLGRAESGFAISDETSTDASVLDKVQLNLGNDTVQDNVIFNGSSVADTIDVSTSVDGSSEVFSVARRGDTKLDIYESGTGFGRATVTVNAQSSADTININGTVGGTLTTINAGAAIDTINVGSEASQSGSGNLESVVGALVINGDNADDVLNIDDTGDTDGDADGQLTATTIDGAGIVEGITYDSITTLNVNLGSGPDAFNVLSTHAGSTTVRGGGNSDTVDVESITGATTILGEDGDDTLRVNPVTATETNGLATTLVLDGQTGSDNYDVSIFGNGDSLITVFDTGSSSTEADTLTVNGTEAGDDFLLRASNRSSADGGVAFVAALHDELIERVNYDERLENVVVETAGGDDHVTLDDNWAETTVRGGAGEDQFQIGQIFQSSREADDANIANEDKFATVETTRGFLSNGVSRNTTIEGGDQGDTFVVFRNTAELILDGQNGGDRFTLRSFAEEGSFESSIDTGRGGDTVEYVGNANLDVIGGSGTDTLRVLGTEFSDHYLVTSDSVRGVGRTITYEGIEVLEIDGAEGDDEFFVFSTPSTLTTKLFGGLGNDQFHLGGDSKQVLAENNEVIDPLQGPHDLDGIQGPLEIDGFSGAGSSGGLTSPVMLPGEKNFADSDGTVIAYTGTGEAGTNDVLTLLTADLQTVVDADSTLEAIADLVGRTLTITDGPGLHRFWQIAAIASGSQDQSELTLRNLSLPTTDWALPDSTSSFAVSNLSSNFFIDESQTFDVATVFDDGSTNNDVGSLSSTTLTGLGADGGVTYGNLEILHVLLGTGDDQFAISGVADGTVADVHGGGGSDSITVTGRGDLPLAVYGDTSEDGGLFTSTTGTVEPGFANSFDNDGGDTINASGSSQNIVIYGGPGNDNLTGSQAGDHLAGGAGDDQIHGESGDDHIYGDSSFNVSSQLLAEDQITPFDPTVPADLAKINATFEIVTTAVPGADTIDGGEHQDTIFGDYGTINVIEGTERILSTDSSSVLKIETTNVTLGGDDSIEGSAGDDYLFGGIGNDTVNGGAGRDAILGDHGVIDFVVNDNDNSTVDVIRSTEPLLGGNDSLGGGSEKDVLFGGTANDVIAAGSGNDVALGDHGLVDYSLDPNQNFVSILTSDTTGAGNDTIYGDEGDDFILGQQGDDHLSGGEGEDDLTGGHNVLFGADGDDHISGDDGADVVLGDNGVITRTLLDGDEAAWNTYPAPFADVVRDIQRFDNVDLIAGNDTVLGGSGRDILEPQRGDDNVNGGADDDEIIGSEGNDTLAGGAGADFILGDNGQILRAYNADGTPQINGNGIWQRDIVLEEFASITGKIDIDRTPLDSSSLLADEILNTDLLILSGAFDSNGDRVLNQDNNAWDTDILLVDLTAPGNDVIDGGDGADVALGQRGDDNISGGRGADLVIGDNATSLVQFESTMPHIIHGIRVLDVATDVPIEIEFGGSVIVPEINITPQDLSLTTPLTDVVTDVSPELQAVALDDSLSRTDGTNLVPYASLVPGIGRQQDVLAGNDTIDGGSGDDTIYGDNLRAFSEPQSIHSRVDVAAGNVTKRLEDVDESLRRLTNDFDLVEAGVFETHGHDVSIANDSIRGGGGNDTIVGDDGTIITPASTRSAIDTDNHEADAVARLEHLLNVKHLLIDFDTVLQEADVQAVSLLVDDALANNPERNKLTTEDVVVLAHQFDMQNDIIEGGDGDDTIIGDHHLVVLPTASTTKTRSEQFDAQTVTVEVKNDTNAALRDLENDRRIELRDHLKEDHDVSQIPPRKDRKLIPYKSEYDVSMSNDVLNGDAGIDVIIGDRSETVVPVLQELPDRNSDVNSLQSGINAVFGNGDFRDLLNTESREGFTEYRYFPARIHKSERDPSISLDTIDGGTDDDVLFGDNAEFKPIFEKDTPLNKLQYVVTPIEPREGGDDIISGGSGNDIVFAQLGDDLIHGNDGDDTLFGDRGKDILFGDAGKDELRGGSHKDVINDDEADTKASQGGGNGSDELDVTINQPWGDIVSSLYFDGETIDPNTDLWATFARATE